MGLERAWKSARDLGRPVAFAVVRTCTLVRAIAFNTVTQFCILGMLLSAFSVVVVDLFGVTLICIALWSLGLLILFHLLLWVSREQTTQNDLRGLEYVYIIIGLFGVVSFVEIRSTLLETQLKLIVESALQFASAGRAEWCVGDLSTAKETLPKERWIECVLEDEERRMADKYDHRQLKDFLDRIERFKSDPENADALRIAQPRLDRLKGLSETLEYEVFSHGHKASTEDQLLSKYTLLAIRLLGLYVLLVSIAIKFAKTTAEIRRWYVP